MFGFIQWFGAHLVRICLNLRSVKYCASTRNDTDLFSFEKTKQNYFSKPDVVIIAAAKVGGILANNTYRTEFLENLKINMNIPSL